MHLLSSTGPAGSQCERPCRTDASNFSLVTSSGSLEPRGSSVQRNRLEVVGTGVPGHVKEQVCRDTNTCTACGAGSSAYRLALWKRTDGECQLHVLQGPDVSGSAELRRSACPTSQRLSLTVCQAVLETYYLYSVEYPECTVKDTSLAHMRQCTKTLTSSSNESCFPQFLSVIHISGGTLAASRK